MGGGWRRRRVGREGGGERASVAARVCAASSALILLLDSLLQEQLRRAATATRELPRVRREWLARLAHRPLRVHEAAWGHGRQEARRLCVLRRRRHLERKRRRYARHAAAFTPLSPRCALSAPRNSCDREEKRGTGLFLVVVVTENQSLHTREQAHTKLHAHATNTIRAGPGQSQSVCERPPPLRGRGASA